MKLTIGFSTYDDPSGVELCLQTLLLYHPLEEVELIVVDNHPVGDAKGRPGPDMRSLIGYCNAMGAKYVPLPSPTGTAAPRDKIFAEASGDVVIVSDGHVMFAPSLIPAVREYFAIEEHSRDLLTGPILRRQRRPGGPGLVPMATHYADVWRSEMWGIWSQAWQCPCGAPWHFDVAPQMPQASRPEFAQGKLVTVPPSPATPLCDFFRVAMGRVRAEKCPFCSTALPSDLPYARHEEALESLGYVRRAWDPSDDQPFEITGLGLGMFAARKDHWPGFPAGMLGFGGGELHLHELYRRLGGKAVCHPLAAWWHRFERDYRIPNPKLLPPAQELHTRLERKTPYHNSLWLKVRNYVLWRNRLQMPLDPVYEHFVTREGSQLTDAHWLHLLADPRNRVDWPGNLRAAPSPVTASRPQPPAAAVSVSDIYDWQITQRRDCVEHLPTIRSLASQADIVVGLVKRREWDVAVLAGLEDRKAGMYYSHNLELDPLLDRLRDLVSVPYLRDASDSLAADPVACDLLLIDTVHTGQRLKAELQLWAPFCRRWIALRGTKTFGEQAEGAPKQPGLLVAAREFCETSDHGWHRVLQEDKQYGLTLLSRDPDERTIDRGPGTELHAIFAQIGINPTAQCGCREMTRKMDSWEAAGCRSKMHEIVAYLKSHQEQYGWSTKLKAAAGVMTTGLWLKVKWSDPFPGLVEEAIRRAEAADAAWNAREP